MDKNSFRILSLEARDLYLSNTYRVNKEYSYKDKNGNPLVKRFRAIFDDCLETEILLETYERKVRNKKNIFTHGDANYLTSIVSVSFNYNIKEYIKYGNKYYRYNYNFDPEDEFLDGVLIKDGVLMAIEVGVDVPQNGHEFPLFPYKNGKYELLKLYGEPIDLPIPFEIFNAKMDTLQNLREYLYKNGFNIDGVHYVRYKRSAGASREGNCLFIDERLYSEMNKWSLCGLDESCKEIQENLVSYEAYRSLTLSSIEKTIEINPKSILLLSDKKYKSIFKDTVANVYLNDDNSLGVAYEEVEVENKIFDGEGLLDSSVFVENCMANKGMMLLRNRYFKSCVFNTNIQQFFNENQIINIDQLDGITLAEDVKDIKMIITESSLKYLKFGSFQKWIDNVASTFGVVKTDKPTHHFDGEMVLTSYQLLNTINLTEDEIYQLMKDTFEYRSYIAKDPDVLRFDIGLHSGHVEYDPDDDSFMEEKIFNLRNKVVFDLLQINSDFYKTELYKHFKSDLIAAMRNRMLSGRILVNGNYSTLFGNGYELLKASIKQFDVEKDLPLVMPGTIMSTAFKDGEDVLSARNPHITMGNILVSKNVYHEEYFKYFNLTKEIVCVNSINQNILQQLNGCDFDSDTMLLTNNAILLEGAKRDLLNFKVPFTSIPDKVRKNIEMFEIDGDIANNLIGDIVNLSQILNSYYWDKSIDLDREELYKNICKLAVLSNFEIDKAKRTYPCSNAGELSKIRFQYDELLRHSKPLFFYDILDKKNRNKKDHIFIDTPMDRLMKCVKEKSSENIRTNIRTIKFSELVGNVPKSRGGSAKYKNTFILGEIVRINNEIMSLRSSFTKNKSNSNRQYVFSRVKELEKEAVDLIKVNVKTPYSGYLLLESLSDSESTKAWFIILYAILKANSEMVRSLLVNKKNMRDIVRTDGDECDYIIYGRNYCKK